MQTKITIEAKRTRVRKNLDKCAFCAAVNLYICEDAIWPRPAIRSSLHRCKPKSRSRQKEHECGRTWTNAHSAPRLIYTSVRMRFGRGPPYDRRCTDANQNHDRGKKNTSAEELGQMRILRRG